MSKHNWAYFLAIVLTTTFSGCSSLTECETIAQKEAIILIDVSDKKLFANIETDLKTNFPGFMQKTGLGSLSPCQSLTLSFAHLSGKEALDLSSATISISRKGQSKKKERQQENPAPLVQLMQQKINDYRLLTENSEMTAGSNIANVLLKAIIHSNPDAKTTILLFSDGVENNRQLNLYKKIPSDKEMSEVVIKLIDPIVLKQFKNVQEQGVNAKIIFVIKPEANGKTNIRDIRNFWGKLLAELNLDVQFIDNLSNSVEI